MNLKQLLIYGVLLIMLSSITSNYGQVSIVSQNQSLERDNFNDKIQSFSEISSQADLGKSGRLRPLSILVYTEFADLTVGPNSEYSNTMNSITETYGSDFIHQNLTDYTNLSAELPNYDIFLIPEQELILSMSNMTTIGSYWSSTLNDYVSTGGIVIGMDYGISVTGFGSVGTLLNSSNLLSINGILLHGSGFTLDLVNSSDALGFGLPSSWSASDGSLVYDMDLTDCTSVAENAGNPTVVHKIQEKGHIVLLGFDMYSRTSESDILLANAIRLHRHVVFDESHGSYFEVNAEFVNFTADLVAEGFAVTVMKSFSSSLINSADVLVFSFGSILYIANMIK